jgi:nitrite reductase/ring-hydroxylating ferredoxin subunit
VTWHAIGTEADASGESTVIAADVDGLAVLLMFGEGRWWAIEDRCSHADCTFTDDGEIDSMVAVCNCHGSEFDVKTGLPVMMPAKEPIRTFPVRVKNQNLEVHL